MIVGGKVCSGHVVFAGRIDPPEAIEVELADEAREVGGFEGVGVAQGVGAGGQDLPLEELRVDDDGLAFTVPEDGPFRRVVHQTPQFSKEVFRIHAGRERPSTHVHASSLKNWKQSELKTVEKHLQCRTVHTSLPVISLTLANAFQKDQLNCLHCKVARRDKCKCSFTSFKK